MQKKRNTKFKTIDIAIIFFCLAGSIASGTAFWLEYNRTLTKLNEDPVAVIVFKKRTAQRRFIDRVVWDTLKQSSPLYNGDTIRTIDLSEAIITFKDEVTHLNLNENTLIQIFFNETDGARIDLSGGNMEVISGSKGAVVISGSSAVKVEGRANLNRNERGFNLSVQSGRAGLNGERIESGGMVSLNANGERDTRPAISITSFGSSARVLGTPGEIVPVVFSWNEYNFNPGTLVIVETALDRAFSRIVERREVNASSVSIPLANGSYWWRAYPADSGSLEPANSAYPSGTLEVIPATAVTAISPAQAERFTVSGDTGVSLSWSAAQGAFAYLLEVSANADISAPVVSRRVLGTSVTQTGLNTGVWYWRVTPIFPIWFTGPVPSSAVNNFSLTRNDAAPVRQTEPPVTGQVVVPPVPPRPVIEPTRERPARGTSAPPRTVAEPRETSVREQIIVPPESVAEPGLRRSELELRPLTEENSLAFLTRVSGSGTISGSFPANGYSITTEQLRNAPSVNFTWEGSSNEYGFALYRAGGENVIPPSTVTESVYTLQNPAVLTEGDYVWQVFERNSGGNWEALPSAAYRLTVIEGEAPVVPLPTYTPGELYGSR